MNRTWCRVLATVLGIGMAVPVLAAPENTTVSDSHWWLGGGIGVAQSEFGSAAPKQSNGAMTLEAGWLMTPHWGLGLEMGINFTDSRCTFCGTNADNLKKEFGHVFLVAEYRPKQYGWRLRAGAGESEIDLYYWDGWEYVISSETTLGGGLSAGYQWHLPTKMPLSLGVRLSGETANFSVRSNQGTASVPYSAATFTVQLVFN